jgi:Na+-driven multidrug efflux pump
MRSRHRDERAYRGVVGAAVAPWQAIILMLCSVLIYCRRKIREALKNHVKENEFDRGTSIRDLRWQALVFL